MSITVRNWTPQDLQAISWGLNHYGATVLANCATFNREMLDALYSSSVPKIREYLCYWNGEEGNPVTIKATSLKTLGRFVDEEYTRRPDRVIEVVKRFKDVELP